MRPDGWRVLFSIVLGALLIAPVFVFAETTPPVSVKTAAKKAEVQRETLEKREILSSDHKKAAVVAEKTDEKTEKTTVTGKFMAATKRSVNVELSEKDGVSDEIMLKLADDVLVGPNPIKSLKDLRTGDTVKIGYEQRYRTDDAGKKIVLSSTAKVIYLVERAAPSAPAAATASGAQ